MLFLDRLPLINDVAFTLELDFTVAIGLLRVVRMMTWTLSASYDRVLHEDLSQKLKAVHGYLLEAAQVRFADDDEGDMVTYYTRWL